MVLIVSWWIIAWLPVRPFSDFYFFPLWLGYILTVDGLVLLRTGTSPIRRDNWRVIWWFVLSAPFWWLFEAINLRLDNWHYHLPREYSDVGYAFWATLAFSTVIPAVLTTTELVRSFGLRNARAWPAFNPGRAGLFLMLTWPRYFFPLCWLSLYVIVDPATRLLGGRSLSSFVAKGDWTPVINLAIAGVICGWFWEMWNVQAMPKWTYSVPYVDFLRVWEMPILGYGGYIPFAFEIYALYALVLTLTRNSVLPRALAAAPQN